MGKIDLQSFTGTENYFYNPLYRWLKYTDGVKFFLGKAGCYWFLDIIGTELMEHTREEDFIHIKLEVSNDKAKIIADDGNGNVLYKKSISFTDCPEGFYSFYLTNSVLMLPSEY